MTISELIKNLEITKKHYGDMPCLVEVIVDDVATMAPIGELSLENREKYGDSVALLQ